MNQERVVSRAVLGAVVGAGLVIFGAGWIPALRDECSVIVVKQHGAVVKPARRGERGIIEVRESALELRGQQVINARHGFACEVRLTVGG